MFKNNVKKLLLNIFLYEKAKTLRIAEVLVDIKQSHRF